MESTGHTVKGQTILVAESNNNVHQTGNNQHSYAIIETTNGSLKASECFSKIRLCLSHEILSQPHNAASCGKVLSLEHIKYHNAHPLSQENTGITSALLDHELHTCLQRKQLQCQQALICDCSNSSTNDHSLMSKYPIVKGYTYRLSNINSLSSSQKSSLLSQSYVLKQIEYEFQLGNGKFKPGFVGQVTFEQCFEGGQINSIFKAYLQFSSKTRCPIVVNMIEAGQPATDHLFTSNESLQMSLFTHQYDYLEQILSQANKYKTDNVIIYNPPILLRTALQNNEIITSDVFGQRLEGIFQKYKFLMGYDLLRYNNSKMYLLCLAQVIKSYPERVLLSAGLMYRTDLSIFGGEGLASCYSINNEDSSILFLRSLIDNESTVEQVCLNNKLRVLSWKTLQEEVKIVVKWRCDNCSIEHAEQIQSFRKFGKLFCSIKCLKQFKF